MGAYSQDFAESVVHGYCRRPQAMELYSNKIERITISKPRIYGWTLLYAGGKALAAKKIQDRIYIVDSVK